MSTFTDAAAALEEAEFMATRFGAEVYLILVGGAIEVRRHLQPNDVVLEIVKPTWEC